MSQTYSRTDDDDDSMIIIKRSLRELGLNHCHLEVEPHRWQLKHNCDEESLQ